MMETANKILGEKFSVFLSKKLNTKFKLLSIQRIFGGASRETYRVKLQDEEKKSQNFIYRRSQKKLLNRNGSKN